MSKPTVYISGPMTGYENYNREAFYAAEAHLRSLGFDHIVNPAAMDEGLIEEHPHSWYMRRDIAALLDCDAIYPLPGWRWSKGASLEMKVAEGCGISVWTDADQDTWRTFEGNPLADQTPLRYAGDLSAQDGEGASLAEPGDEDLADHPRFGSVFADVEIEVDDSMPPNTVRFETPAGVIDFDVKGDPQRGIRLERKPEHRLPNQPEEGSTRQQPRYFLDHVERPRPGDEFPNVGYVRRMKALMQDAMNWGGRRSA